MSRSGVERARVRVRKMKECQKYLVPDRNRVEQAKDGVRKTKEVQKWMFQGGTGWNKTGLGSER